MIDFHISIADVLGPVIAVILPLLVALVTKASTDGGVKAILLAVLALVTNLLVGIQDAIVNDGHYDLGKALILGLGTLVISVAVHYGVWKPTGATDALQKRAIKD